MKKHVVIVFVLLLAVFQMHGQIPKGSKILTGGLNGNGYVVSGNNSYFFGPSIGGNVFIRENVSLGIGSGAAMSFSRSGNVQNTGVSVPLTFSIQKWYSLPLKTPLYFVLSPFIGERISHQTARQEDPNPMGIPNSFTRTWHIQGTMGLSAGVYLPIHEKWMIGINRTMLNLSVQQSYTAIKTQGNVTQFTSPIRFDFNIDAGLSGWGIQWVYFLKR